MDWYKVFMWIPTICMLVVLFFERFLLEIVVTALIFVAITIMVVVTILLMDGE